MDMAFLGSYVGFIYGATGIILIPVVIASLFSIVWWLTPNYS